MHTCVANDLLSLSLAFVAEKPETGGRNWSADQLFWQADRPFWFFPHKLVGGWSPSPIAGRWPSQSVPEWSFSLSERGASFWCQ